MTTLTSSRGKRFMFWHSAFALLLILTFLSYLAPGVSDAAGSATITINTSVTDGVSKFEGGAIHTQYGYNTGNATAVASAKNLLQTSVVWESQQFSEGWGVNSAEPSPGSYSWSSLDARMNLILNDGARPVISLCCAPTWMKPDSNIETAPSPSHYGDFAELCRQAALRYSGSPWNVKYFQVWNEMKGFWFGSDGTDWDYVAFTTLYNTVYDALKNDPTLTARGILIGGPYMVLAGSGSAEVGKTGTQTDNPITTKDWTIINYFLANAHGFDFFAVDRRIVNWHDANNYTNDQVMALTHWFKDIQAQLRTKTTKPIFWAEFYGAGQLRAGDGTSSSFSTNLNYIAANYASIYYNMIKGDGGKGVVALLWNPMNTAPTNAQEEPHYIFTDTRVNGGGQASPHYAVLKAFKDYFGTGTQLYQATSNNPEVEVLASLTKTMLINKSSTSTSITVNGVSQSALAGYEVRVINTPGSGFVGRSGTNFTLNGQPYYVGGTNTHYLAWASQFEIDSLLADAVAMKVNVIRTFTSVVIGSLDGTTKPTLWQFNNPNVNSNDLNVHGRYYLYWGTSPAGQAYNDTANGIQVMDYLLYKAGQSGLRILFTMQDAHGWTGGAEQMASWRGLGATAIFTDANVKQDYKNWMSHLLNHVNVHTGIAYKNDPAIFAFELMNEGCPSSTGTYNSWITEMADYFNTIDTNHLIGVGNEGFTNGTCGQNASQEWAIASVDFGTRHIYPKWHTNNDPNAVDPLITQMCDLGVTANKPVLLEEFGQTEADPNQASIYTRWTDLIYNYNNAGKSCAGWLAWRLTSKMDGGVQAPPALNGEGYDYHLNGSAGANALQAAALKMAGKNGGGGPTSTPTNTASGPTNTPTNTPTGGSSTVYEAESGTIVAANASGDAAASGGSKVVNMHLANASVTINNVNGGSGGSATLIIRYDNGAAGNGTKDLYVNNVFVQTVTFLPTGDWTCASPSPCVDLAPVTITLNAGTGNSIKIQNPSGNSAGVDLDKFTVTTSSGPTLTPTNTVPPTNTPTNTPVPPTNTPTNTPVPPTNTPTNTPLGPTNTPTNTSVPPTNTPTNTPAPPTNTPTPSSGNILTNGNIEAGTTGWAVFGAGTLTADTSVFHGGTKSLKMTGRTAAWNGPSQLVTSQLVNGRSYTTNVWVRTVTGSPTARVILRLEAGTTTFVTLAPNTVVNSTGWTLLSGTATVSWSGTLTLARWYVETAAGTDSFYIDDAVTN